MGVGKSKEKAPIKDRKAEEKDENVEFKGMKKTDENDPENKVSLPLLLALNSSHVKANPCVRMACQV